jgi:hypothetical protein
VNTESITSRTPEQIHARIDALKLEIRRLRALEKVAMLERAQRRVAERAPSGASGLVRERGSA